jgi:hypothetical protein
MADEIPSDRNLTPTEDAAPNVEIRWLKLRTRRQRGQRMNLAAGELAAAVAEPGVALASP